MGSHINIRVVQRHLDSVGHTLSSQGVVDLLRDLGFGESLSEEEEEVEEHSRVETTFKEERIAKKIAEITPNPRRTLSKAVSSTTAAALGAQRRAPGAAAGVASLAAKLDALESQLNQINALQENIHQKLDSDYQKRASAPFAAPISLGTEAQQLRDWAAGNWPNIVHSTTHIVHDNRSINSTRTTGVSSVQDQQQQQQRSGSGKVPVKKKKRDPVARYQQIQRIWSRDPFLCSGAADNKTSSRKEQGFRETFAALHSKT